MFSRLVIILLCIFFSCNKYKEQKVNLPFNKIKVLILSKYQLKKITVSCKAGYLFLPERTIDINNDIIEIKSVYNKILIKHNKKVYSANYISISSKNIFTIIFQTNNKKNIRKYKGDLNIYNKNSSLEIVNSTLVEDYVFSSAIGEMGPFVSSNKEFKNLKNWQKELLKSLRISIRSYVFHFKDRHPSQNYQFCDLTHCVYFPGIIKKSNSKLELLIMLEKNNFLPAYFHSTCGGTLLGPESYWLNHKYFKSFRRGSDKGLLNLKNLCKNSPHFTWSKFISFAEINKIFETKIIDIKLIFFRKDKYRVSELTITNDKNKEIIIPVSKFLSKAGKLLGWHVLKSNFFKIKKVTGGFEFTGRGLGHGIGLCQWGANKLAKEGKDYKYILNHYYNNPTFSTGVYHDDN